MCGIAGIISRKRDLVPDIIEMTNIQRHRGPDGNGILTGGHDNYLFNPQKSQNDAFWALGHVRLSVVDISTAGTQPMSYDNGCLWITFNGEIYNYIELKEDLSKSGYTFKTHTDTEVILAAYHAWGTDCFKKFVGMWSMAILDRRNRILILSRDRFGEKPLHFFKGEDKLLFSSEIKGITTILEKSQNLFVNFGLVKDYLRYDTLNHTNSTFFKDIESFPPSCYAIINIDNPTNFSFKKYWDITSIQDNHDISFEDAKDTFRSLFLSSVSLQMRSDVPLGFCLSGGLDSSSIVSVSRHLSEKNNTEAVLRTFTSDFDNQKYSEMKWAEIVNQYTRAQSTRVFPDVEGFISELPNLIWHQEAPFPTMSIYAQWMVMKAAREKNIKVMLDGQGADEILCGYKKFYLFHLIEILKAGDAIRAVKEVYNLSVNGDPGILSWREGIKYAPKFIRKIFNDGTPFINESLLDSQLDFGSSEAIKQKTINDILYFSIPPLLRYEDRNSMAWSVESRVPFLDYRLVEFLISLPTEYKLSNGKTKHIMRQALEGIVPNEILTRKDKKGFDTPQDVWMKGKLGNYISSSFASSDSRISEFVDVNQIKASLRSHQNLDLIFKLFILDQWAKKFKINFP